MINNITDFIKASKEFSMPIGQIEAKEMGRREFISKFPLSSIQSLTLDNYCVGTSENSFCYWLEFKNILFGIGGGNATKFGIYKSKDGNYYEGYGPKKISLDRISLDEKFAKLKLGIVQGLKFVEQNDIEKISTIQSPLWNMVLLKIFCIYYPDRFLTIGDPDVIIECARNIGITGIELKNENSIIINYLCRKKLNETSKFSSWEYEKIGTFVWVTFKETAKRDYYIIGSKYGEKADEDVFPEMLKRSVIATGFASNLDLTEFYNENHSVIKAFLVSHNEESNSINALKHFLSLKPGDMVAVKGDGSPKGKEGYLSIVGIAEVIEKDGKVYEHDPNGLGQTINVKYLEAPIFKELGLGGYGRTIHKLSNEEHIRLIFKEDIELSYYKELIKFLAQTETDELATSSYLNFFQGLSVKVGFGQGNKARIPWIAFLKESQTVQDGIYPVYLFYKEQRLLILAYGVSETHIPSSKWEITNEKTIEQYFAENNLGQPKRYGTSYVFKSYDINFPLVEEEINGDLINLINTYKTKGINPEPVPQKPFQYEVFTKNISDSGLFIDRTINLRFIAALLTKPFVILTGLSGSGKTKLAQAFATWICENINQYCIIPVGADWTNREPLLGFPNALKTNEYVKPDNGVMDLLISANKDQKRPYFLILDEMNLSHVERYFADFLSVMESNSKIWLHPGTESWNDVPPQISIPPNLFIIGTVNIDETTYMFSPKVLDRASVIEFRVTSEEMGNYLNSNSILKLEDLRSAGADMAKSFVSIAKDENLVSKNAVELKDILLLFFKELKKTGAEFGYRSASEIRHFAALVNTIEPGWTVTEIIDAAIMQKLLPKVHGSRKKLEKVLLTLARMCTQKSVLENKEFKIESLLNSEQLEIETEKLIYPVSFEKISRMYKGLLANGFTSYAEA
jgi:5-methylcytosine-specific restriction protein B